MLPTFFRRFSLVPLALVAALLGGCGEGLPEDNAGLQTETAAVSSGGVCNQASDCTGALPMYCVQCPNTGTSACAQWTCTNNTCQVRAVCP
jgi:hypothetical protein